MAVIAGPTALKIAGAVGSICACGAGALAVALDARPAQAPLRPPVSDAQPAVPSPAASGDGGLLIPSTATCAQGGGAGAQAQPPPVPAGLSDAVARLRQATTAADRQAVLAQLTADQRLQATAYLRLVAQAQAQGRGGGRGAAGLGCRGGAGASGGTVQPIDPSVVAGDAGAPVVVSAVS